MSEEVRITDPTTGGAKGQKPERMALLPWDALRLISRTFHYGATKYHDAAVGPYNWRRGYAWSLSFDALQRHLAAFWDGEDVDPESRLPHVAHAGWHVLALIWFTLHKPEHDDRPRAFTTTATVTPTATAGPSELYIYRLHRFDQADGADE